MVRKITAVIGRTLKSRRVSLSIYLGVAFALNWMYVAMFTTFQSQAEQLSEVFKTLPESFAAAFGASELAFSTLEGFLALENFGFLWPLLVILIIAGLAGASLAGEIEKDTIELVLSRPISRTAYFFGKYLATVLASAAFVLVSILSVILFAEIYNVPYVLGSYATLALAGLAFAWAIIGIAFMFAAIFSEKSKVFFMTGGVLFLMYILQLLARLNENLEGLRYVSIFYYFDSSILTDGTVPLYALIVLAGTAIVTTVLALWRWRARDIHV